MWKTLLTILQSVFTLARDLEENRKEIKELNEKIYALASALRSLAEKIDANAQHETSDRKALVLQIENELLKAGKKVSLPKSGRKTTTGKKSSQRK